MVNGSVGADMPIDYSRKGTDKAIEYMDRYIELFPDEGMFQDLFDDKDNLIDEDGYDERWYALVDYCAEDGD